MPHQHRPAKTLTDRHRVRLGLLLSAVAAALAVPLGAACESIEFRDGDEPIGRARQQVTATSKVFVNQLGYVANMSKVASVVGSGCAGLNFNVKEGAAIRFSGTTTAAVTDPGSGDTVCKADFSTYVPSTWVTVTLDVPGFGTSDPFTIYDKGASLYPEDMYRYAMYYFTYHRLGTQNVNIALPGSKGGTVTRNWTARSNVLLGAYNGWTTGTFNIDGGHMDAGDFGVYADNAVQAMWVLMNLQELKAPGANLTLLPDSTKDLLSEAIYGTKFLKGLLPADTSKLASHKCHDLAWHPDQPWGYTGGDNANRRCMGPSSTATFSVARGLAQMVRLAGSRLNSVTMNGVTQSETGFWNAAKDAWARVQGKEGQVWDPNNAAFSPGFAIGGGPYNDPHAGDDKFAAAVELYLTAKAKGEAYSTYLSVVNSTGNDCRADSRPTGTAVRCLGYVKRRYFDWEADAGPGNLSLMAYHLKNGGTCTSTSCSGGISADVTQLHLVRNAIVAEADNVAATIAANGYPVSIVGNDYPWGSNKVILHGAMIAAYAHILTGDVKYQKAIHQSMDYLFGQNTLRLSFITGYGSATLPRFESATHDRQANGNSPLGWVSGGPINGAEVNDYDGDVDSNGAGCAAGENCAIPSTPRGGFAAKNYAVFGVTSPSGDDNDRDFDWAWCSRENTVDWNAPYAWVLWYMRNPGGSTSCTPDCSGKVCGNDGCGGSCGSCAGGQTCNTSGQCVASCTPNCAGKVCGNDGCGGSCGTCTGAQACNASGQCVATGLPSPWLSSDIGAVGAVGSSTSPSSGAFTLNGSGADIWGAADEFHYAYQPVSGNVTITAKVDSVSNTNTWAKAGVMIRETVGGTSATSRHAFAMVRPDRQADFQYRLETQGTSGGSTLSGGTSSVKWVRLVRSGNNFTASYSTDGTNFTQVGSTQTITMASSVYAGLAVTSHNDGTLAVANFSNVTVSTGGSGGCSSAADCNDDNPCTNDACVSGTCTYTNNTASCNDNNLCTVNDVCSGGTCSGTPANCNDNNPCTADSCSPGTGCINSPVTNGSSCNDNNPNTCNDVCTSGVCGGSACGSLDPVAKYDFNQSSGTTATDSSGNGNHATLSGATFATGFSGNGVRIAGGTQRVNLPANIVQACSDATGFTIAARVMLATNGSNWTRIFDFGSSNTNYMFLSPRAGASNVLRFALKYSSGSEQQLSYTYAFPTNTWKHVAVTLSGNTATLYLDGAQVAQNTSFTNDPSGMGATANNWLGKSQFSADPTLDGTIDDLQISCRTLSASEISALANTASGCTSAADCNDNNVCTTEACTSGVCTFTNNTLACSDDGNSCTNDVCSAGLCTHPNKANGTACNDGNVCTSNDVCTAGVCGGTNNTASCDDGNSNTCNDVCSGGSCGGGSCGASTPCTGLCSNPVVFTTASYQSGNLGPNATCHETTVNLSGANFGNMVSPRTMSVNGTSFGSAGGNITLPAKRNGGYCFQATAGANDWAYFGTW
jgi:endoglucanase